MVEVGFLVFETDQTSGEPHATQWKICPKKINKENQPKNNTNNKGWWDQFEKVPNVYLDVKPSK